MSNAAPSFEEETEEAKRIAVNQAERDFPYTFVGEARPFQYHFRSGRWYVEVDLHHHEPEEGSAIALYRISRGEDGAMRAMKVDIREAEHLPVEQQEEHDE